MQIALTRLLRRARPHRLLIEPTGLGHPLEVLQALAAEHLRDVISLQRTLTLVDARKLSDARYSSHPVFQQQCHVADVIVANKEDLYAPEDRGILEQFVLEHRGNDVDVLFTRHGQVALHALDGPCTLPLEAREQHTAEANPLLAGDLPFPDGGYLTAVNGGEGFESIGWRFSPRKVFSYDRLRAFLSDLDAERMKAVFITERGIFGYNLTPDGLMEMPLDECAESRIEIIADCIAGGWEQQLVACLAP